jgi:hypothetical protein
MFVEDGQSSQLEYTTPMLFEIVQVMKEKPNNVWLIADDVEEGHIFVTHDFDTAIQYIKLCDKSNKNDLIHIHGYPSYESAYAVALDMRECSPFCYDEDEDISEFISELN